MNIKEAATLIWKEKQEGRRAPVSLQGQVSLEDSYPVQMEVLALQEAGGEALAGWKVGLTAKAVQEMFGFHEPAFGHLLNSGRMESGAAIGGASLINPQVEAEICVVMGETLQGPGVTIAEARAAMGGIFPALELIEMWLNPSDDIPLFLAENVVHTAFVTGPVTAPLDAGANLLETTVEVIVNGITVESGKADAVVDGPEGSVAWLADKLAEFGRPLEKGQVVMTGSMIKPYAIKTGDRVEARFKHFGTVELLLE
ncbi:MAG: fumarylacetoacetate hydrolase family protein [bacterium]